MDISPGIDIISVNRIKRLIDNGGNDFLKKHFTEKEINYCNSKQNPEIHFAGKLAAKESVFKILKYNNKVLLSWKNICIYNIDNIPHVELKGDFKKQAELEGIKKIKVSISHCDEYAVAVAVSIGEKNGIGKSRNTGSP